MAEQRILLALGAHADDCPFGLAGTMLLALDKGYRVVILNLIGDYGTDLAGRSNGEFLQQIAEANGRRGAETRFLPFRSGRLDSTAELIEAAAEVVAELRPTLAFHLWPKDTHADHVAAAPVCHRALQLAGRILSRPGVPSVWRRYTYDNGPYHTIDYVPNTFVDITPAWDGARTWVGEISAVYRNRPFAAEEEEPPQRTKEIIAAYRGLSSGVDYAEAFHTDANAPTVILDV